MRDVGRIRKHTFSLKATTALKQKFETSMSKNFKKRNSKMKKKSNGKKTLVETRHKIKNRKKPFIVLKILKQLKSSRTKNQYKKLFERILS